MTRSEAKAAGLKHYDEGCVCPRKHLPVRRLVSTGGCCACGRETRVEYYKQNPAKHIALSVAWAKRNPEKTRAKDRRRNRIEQRKAYRAANLEKLKARLADWQRRNPGKRRANEARRRAAENGNGGSYTDRDIADLLEAQNGKCGYCSRSIRKKFHVDHIIPLKLGGTNARPNLQLLCASCNSSKGAKHPTDYARTIGLLL